MSFTSLSRFYFFGLILISISCMQLQATSFAEVYTVLRRYVAKPSEVGEIVPLSKAAGFELSHAIKISKGTSSCQRRFLEIGGGCGAVSVCLAQQLGEHDFLDVIEIDPEMCAFLQQRLQAWPHVTVHCCNILDWHPDYLYDGIISTLPFNSLGLNFTKDVIAYVQKSIQPTGMFSYVEYPIVRQLLQYMYSARGKRSFWQVQEELLAVRAQYLKKQVMIYGNVPPVMIYHLQF